MEPGNDLWVFGYGSLIWRPGFAFEDKQSARLVGFRRAFCVYSTFHRGTEARPGLVLGLDRGGVCDGVAYRVAAERREETLHYLREREQVYGVYREFQAPLQLFGGRNETVSAVTYVVERAHPSYAHHLPFANQVAIIRSARGLSGANIEYLVNSSEHLRELGIRDRNIERLAVAAGGLFSSSYGDPEALRQRSLSLAATCQPGVAAGPQLPLDQRRRFGYRNKLG